MEKAKTLITPRSAQSKSKIVNIIPLSNYRQTMNYCSRSVKVALVRSTKGKYSFILQNLSWVFVSHYYADSPSD